MSYRTLEVELEDGRVRSAGSDTLPLRARALLTVLDDSVPKQARTCAELAEWWSKRDRLPLDEANEFADDIEMARRSLPPIKSAWD